MKGDCAMVDTILHLIENGDEIIRFRTVNEVLNIYNDEKLNELYRELIESKVVIKRLKNLEDVSKIDDFNGIHGATNFHLENSLPRILDCGIKAGESLLDDIMIPILQRIKRRIFPVDHVFHIFPEIIMCPFLIRAGYIDNDLQQFLEKRIENIYDFVRHKNYDIYDERTNYKGIPKAFKNKKVIKPELYRGGRFSLPLIYDLYAFSLADEFLDEINKMKINTIIEYIIDERYNKLDTSYGILLNGNRSYLVMGWDCKLPEIKGAITSEILNFLEWLSFSNIFRESNWCKEAFELFFKYKTDRNTFIFTKESLNEKNGVWIKGSHMSLGENRRKKNAMEIESTFRALKILQKNGKLGDVT